MRKGALEEASALAVKIGRGIARHNSRELRKLDEKACPKDLWECVNSLTHPRKTMAGCKVTADELNQHFAATSTDNSYQQVDLKTTANLNQHNTSSLMSRYSMFSITCDQLQRVLMDFRHGSSGCWLRSALDQLPDLSTNLCVAHGSHDNGKLPLFTRHQKSPQGPSDYRPISVVPILSRVVDRLVVHTYMYLYPTIIQQPFADSIKDQYAFRPTESTTAALIYL